VIVKTVDEEYEALNTRNIVNAAWFEFWRVVRYYLRRTINRPNREVFSKALEDWVKLMAPITPHIAEEIWHEVFGKDTFVSVERFPEADESKIDEKAEKMEEFVQRTVEDIREIMKLAKVEKPERVVIMLADEWKYDAFRKVREMLESGVRNVGQSMDAIPAEHRKDVAKLLSSAVKNPKRIPEVIGTRDEEKEALEQAREFIEAELGVTIEIAENYDHPKRKNALPFKPAILVE
jgi:leucyl-tRNA synthetase